MFFKYRIKHVLIFFYSHIDVFTTMTSRRIFLGGNLWGGYLQGD